MVCKVFIRALIWIIFSFAVVYRPPNLGSGRKIQPGQLIHASVLDHMRNNPTYRPRAQLYNGYSWDAFSLDDVASGSDVFQGPWPIGIEEDFHAAIVTETLSLLKSAPIPSQRITDTLAGVLASCKLSPLFTGACKP